MLNTALSKKTSFNMNLTTIFGKINASRKAERLCFYGFGMFYINLQILADRIRFTTYYFKNGRISENFLFVLADRHQNWNWRIDFEILKNATHGNNMKVFIIVDNDKRWGKECTIIKYKKLSFYEILYFMLNDILLLLFLQSICQIRYFSLYS